MKLDEVIRSSERTAAQEQKEKEAAKLETYRERVVQAYVRGLSAPQYKPHANTVSLWLFGKRFDFYSVKSARINDDLERLIIWVNAIAHVIGHDPVNDEATFRALSYHLEISHEFVDFVCKNKYE